jgi:hypothetical protein
MTMGTTSREPRLAPTHNSRKHLNLLVAIETERGKRARERRLIWLFSTLARKRLPTLTKGKLG